MGVKILDYDELEAELDQGSAYWARLLESETLRALLETAKQGRAFYAVALKYGLKHKAGCSDAKCDCGLVAEIQAVMNPKRD